MRRLLLAATVAAALAAAAPAAHAEPGMCSADPYPKLHAELVDYAQMPLWRSDCSQHPRALHRLLTTGCNLQECNYASGLAYRRWVRHFVRSHGGLPGDDLILGA